MTDKQIIIDSIDVSGCVKLRPYNECGCQPNYGGSYGLCSEWGNCYYKQYQRAEKQLAKDEEIQVDMRLKIDELYGERNILNTANGALNNLVAELEEKYKVKEQECERLKEEMFAHFHKTGEVPALLGFTIDDIANLVKENNTLKQYKKSKQASYEQLQARCNELELENRKLKADNDILTWQRDEAQKHQYCLAYDETCLKGNEKCIYSTCAFKSIFKLKALVQDIKHIAEDQKDVLESMRIDIAEQILNKISEVLDEEI